MTGYDMHTSLAEIGAESVRKACEAYRTAPLEVVLDLASELYVAIAPQLNPDERAELRDLLHATRADRAAKRLREILVGRAVVADLGAVAGGDEDAGTDG